jgi:hypothetical protein
MATCDVRVYGPLNDFLPSARRQTAAAVTVADRPAVKDVVEGLGVPHRPGLIVTPPAVGACGATGPRPR